MRVLIASILRFGDIVRIFFCKVELSFTNTFPFVSVSAKFSTLRDLD